MKLLLSALLAVTASATVPALFAQEYVQPQPAQAGVATMEGAGQRASQASGLQSLDLQAVPQSSPDQTGCPVVLTQAHLNWPATYLPVTAAEKATEPNLALGFQNPSGKAIGSVSITAKFLGKTSKYQLDASAFELNLTFSGADSADKTAEQLREIRLPEKMYAYGVTRVSLDQVTFEDGTVWSAVGHSNCALNVAGSLAGIAQ